MSTTDPAEPAPPAARRDPVDGVIEVELAQSLGLAEALTIGIGTMIGAGIFVLPGFIIGKAGPGAVLAFALGGLVALLNALAAAEVATGMPKSGGGYYFISRAMGPLWGAIIGWGSWFGLIFATAFYAVGFGEYVHSWIGISPIVLGIGMTALLVGLNLIGSKAAGQAQNLIVGLLIAVMVLFIGRGAPEVEPSLLTSEGGFIPFGLGAVFAGTATLFVTYCGFGEIASMAEEIKDPGVNLPKALLGSVISVTLLYCLVIGMCVMIAPHTELTGPTVVADLADQMMGGWGRAAILVGAVLATVSSANASIMSASRICFAMGRDDMLWPWLNEVHPRFRVPHRAVVVTGMLIVAVVLIGNIELLAEAAGVLHLLMYGLMSLACIVLRGARPLAYRPVYRVPFYPWVPILGAVGTAAIACFMAPIIIAMGVGIVVFAVAHYWFWARKRTTVRGAWPSFLRRSVLEPAISRVERWGAEPVLPVTIVTAVRNPHREHARVAVSAALLHDLKGRIIAVNVHKVDSGDRLDDEALTRYHAAITERETALRNTAAPVVRAGTQVVSHVPLAAEVLPAIVSTAELSNARVLFLGWPAPHADQPAQFQLLADLARMTRAHVAVLRERGPIPPRSIVVFAPETESGRIALQAGSRLATAWGVPLTAAVWVPHDAKAEDMVRIEADLAERVGETARADVRAVPAQDRVAAATACAAFWQMVVLPAPDTDDVDETITFMQALEPVVGSSLLVVRARPDVTMEPWE